MILAVASTDIGSFVLDLIPQIVKAMKSYNRGLTGIKSLQNVKHALSLDQNVHRHDDHRN